jgi:hypothetical protein
MEDLLGNSFSFCKVSENDPQFLSLESVKNDY